MKVTFKVITSTYCLEYISSASVLKIIPEEEDLSALKDGVGGGQSQQRQGRCGAGWQFNRFFGCLNHGLTHPQPEVTHL